MKKISRTVGFVLALALCFSLAACSTSSATASPTQNGAEAPETTSNPITIKVGSQDVPNSLAAQLLDEFKANVEEKSGGEITVDLYYSSTLGSLNDMIEGVSMGTIDMVTAGIGSYQGYCDNIMIFDSNLLGSSDDFLAVWNSDVGRQVLQQLRDETGIYVIGYNLSGVGKLEFWTGKDYTSIADLKNANLRTNGAKTVNLACASIGAVGVAVSNAEQYNAYQTGMIDAMCLDATNMFDLGYMEKGMYELDILHNFLASSLAISENTWDKLTAQQQEIISECAQIYSDSSSELNKTKLQTAEEKKAEFGIIPCSISAEEVEEINRVVGAALNDYYEEYCDQAILDQALAILNKN